MSPYEQWLGTSQQTGVTDIVAECKQLVPKEYQRRPYRHPELNSGVSLLQSEDAMNAYMAAYGEMHIAKCRAALQNFPYDRLNGSVEIVDWGCGQGIGSLCVIEALDQRDASKWIKRVTLIEPSPATLRRAEMNVEKATNGGVAVLRLNNYLPGHADNALEGLSYCAQNVIHVFSNILDIDGIDLAGLARMVARTAHQHFVLCMGPVNARSCRIDLFCKIFGAQSYFSDLNDPNYDRTTDTLHPYTCKTKCFLYNGLPLDYSVVAATPPSVGPAYSDYDPRLAVQNGVMSGNLRKLYLVLINKVSLTDDDFVILQPDINGDKPDLVVVRPDKGILIINLFERELKEEKDLACSALSTIQVYQENLLRLHIKGMIDKVILDTRNWSLVKKMIVFTKNSQAQVDAFYKDVDKKYKYTYCFGKEILDDKNLQKNLIDKLRFYYTNKAFDRETLRSFLHIINPKWHSYKEGTEVNLTAAQRRLSVSEAGKKQKISGVAGSGKTQVLATRAVNAQVRTGRKVLILMFNKTLVNYMCYRLGEVRADFPWDKITVDYYHGFFRSQANNCGLHLNFDSYDNEDFFENQNTERYSAILIDEVQDYLTVWLKILEKYFLEEDGEFVVFGDPKQNIYNRDLDKKGDIRIEFISGSWNHELKDAQRFTNPQLTHLATAFQQAFYPSDLPTDVFERKAVRDTPLQTSMFTRIKYENIGITTDIGTIGNAVLKMMEANELQPKDTVILSQTGELLRDVEHYYCDKSGKGTTSTFISFEQFNDLLNKYNLTNFKNSTANDMFKSDKDAIEHGKKIHFTTATDHLKMSTIHSFKGWECINVILIIQPETGNGAKYSISSKDNSPELIYTAITRARENLFIINLGHKRYHSFFSSRIS